MSSTVGAGLGSALPSRYEPFRDRLTRVGDPRYSCRNGMANRPSYVIQPPRALPESTPLNQIQQAHRSLRASWPQFQPLPKFSKALTSHTLHTQSQRSLLPLSRADQLPQGFVAPESRQQRSSAPRHTAIVAEHSPVGFHTDSHQPHKRAAHRPPRCPKTKRASQCLGRPSNCVRSPGRAGNPRSRR